MRVAFDPSFETFHVFLSLHEPGRKKVKAHDAASRVNENLHVDRRVASAVVPFLILPWTPDFDQRPVESAINVRNTLDAVNAVHDAIPAVL